MNQPYPDVAFVADYLPLPRRTGAPPPDLPAGTEAPAAAPRSRLAGLLRRPTFIVAVLIPNLLALLYFGLVAAPVYVSTTSLVVLNPQKAGPSLSSLLAGASGDSSEEGGYLLKDYLASWQAYTKAEKPLALASHFRQGDVVSRYGGVMTLFRDNDVALWHYLNRRVDVDIDQKSGIVTLKTEAYRPEFAHALTSALLADAIAHMDAMNAEQERDYVAAALARKQRIERALEHDLAALANYRIVSGSYDPKELYASNLSLLNGLALKAAELKAQRDAVAGATPNNPVATVIGSQLTSVQGNIAASQQLFPKLARGSAAYEKLLTSRDNNISLLNQANMAVQEAQNSAEKNRYYLNVISTPSQPQTPEEPRRLLWIVGIFLCSMVVWGVVR